jgi:NAD+ kinase
MARMSAIARVGIVAKLRLAAVAPHLVELAAWLEARGVEPVFETETAALANLGPTRRAVPRDDLASMVDLLLVLGGDGTLLAVADRASHAGRNIPILGVNFGHLGFLTELSWPDVYGTLEQALAGTAAIDERMMLRATVRRNGCEVADHVALNDVVITRGALSRIIELSVSVGGEFVARFNADGLIISTPTGSTAYNLSAGGPILHPGVDALVITPIAPHILSNRPVVIPATHGVTVQPHLADATQEVVLTVDGQSAFALAPDDVVTLTRSAPARLIASSSHRYFDVLREKLKWAER